MPTDIDRAIADLQADIRRKQEDLEQLLRAKRILVGNSIPPRTPVRAEKSKSKPKSAVRLAERALEMAGHPLHVDDVRKVIANMGIAKKRIPTKSSLASTLLRYSKEGRVFRKTAPNTFDLLERTGTTAVAA